MTAGSNLIISGERVMNKYMQSYLIELINSKKRPDLMCEHVVKQKQFWAYCTLPVLKNPAAAVGCQGV